MLIELASKWSYGRDGKSICFPDSIGWFLLSPPSNYVVKCTGLLGTCVIVLLCFHYPRKSSYPSTPHPCSSFLSPFVYLCLSHSLLANTGCIYLFYLGMVDSWVCSSACPNRGICRNCQKGGRQSLNHCSRDWVQCVLHVYLVVPLDKQDIL